MIKPQYELTGQRFGNWTVIGRSQNMRSPSVRWSVRCACGQISSRQSTPLRRGTSTCCNVCAAKKMLKSSSEIRNRFSGYRANARSRGIEFALTVEQFTEITAKNCHYCDVQPKEFIRCRSKHHPQKYLFNGIDRKDNSLGYTPENSLPCCEFCNFRKGKCSYEDFISWMQRITRIWITRIC